MNNISGNLVCIKDDETNYYEYLTPREAEVMLRLLERKADREISEELGISIHTVKFHKKNIYSKWGVSRRIEAINFFHQKLH